MVNQKLNKLFVGIYLIDDDKEGTQLATTSKPNWFRRLYARIFLDWEWVGINELKTK